MRDKDFYTLKSSAQKILYDAFEDFFEKHRDDDQCLYEAKTYIDIAKGFGYTLDAEKIKIILSVLYLKNDGDVKEILSYIDRSIYGWQGQSYELYNRCLQYDQRCRRFAHIANDSRETSKAFADIDEIFLHKEYGAITSYLFGYSLASLFTSRLKRQHRGVPYFLQIACKHNSNVYRLVHEIVRICDINAGLFENCIGFEYVECNHDHMTLYPSGSVDSALASLIYYRDIPVVVDGYENEKLYGALLREIVNIAGKTKRLDLKAKFEVLPIFLCPEIKSQFQNIFSVDLTNLEIEDEYIDLIIENRQRLGSWVYELVINANDYFDAKNSSAYNSRPEIARIIERRIPEYDLPLFYDLDDYINHFRTNPINQTKLTSKDITNIGYLMYFFSRYLRVFGRSIQLSAETSFTYRTRIAKHNPTKLIARIEKETTSSLFNFHSIFAPTQPESINIKMDSPYVAETKRIRRKGSAYAKDIEKYYQSYGVSIRILPDAEYKDSRYVFSVKLLPGTDGKLIGRYAEEVRRLLELEVFIPDITPAEIKLIASEEPLNENSLTKILESAQFRESRMEIPYAVGYDIMGEMVIADVAEFPHLLIGGVTNSGKSSAIHSLLMSIVCKQSANKVKLLLIDFGASGLKMFDKVPHMLQPTIRASEIEKGRQSILWLQKETERRLKEKDFMDERMFIAEQKKWPSIVCVIDEFPAFIRQLTGGRGNKNSNTIIEDLLARARKVKIHLILAAQDTTNGGLGIKNTNLAAGIAFKCTNWHTSKAIIDGSEATKLFGKGAMYLKCSQYDGIRRLQGSYMPIEEIMDTLDAISFTQGDVGRECDEVKSQIGISQENTAPGNLPTVCGSQIVVNNDEQLLVEIVKRLRDEKKKKMSNKWLKDEFEMGYDRANRFLKLLEEAGIISAQRTGTKLPRSINLEKIEAFLDRYGYEDDLIETAPEQILNASDMQIPMEAIQEQKVESIDESTPDSQGHTAEPPVMTQYELPQIDKETIKKIRARQYQERQKRREKGRSIKKDFP